MSSAGFAALLRVEMLPVLSRLPAYSRLAWAVVRDPRVAPAPKALVFGGVAYLFSPLDLIPGFIPLLGQLDDLAVALWSLRTALRAAPAEVAEGHLARQGLSWEVLDADLGRVGRSGRLVTRTALQAGGRAVAGLGRSLWRLGRRLVG